MYSFEVMVNILGLGIRQHIIKAADKARIEERIQRAYPNHTYDIISVRKL